MRLTAIFYLTLPLLLLSSCNNNDDAISIDDRNEALFGQWEYEAIISDTAVDINGDGTANIDLYNTNEIRQCLKDNITAFAFSGEGNKNSYFINESGLTCGEVDAFSNVEEDQYELINNKTLRFDNRNDMTIIEFTSSRLVLQQADVLDNIEVVISYTFKRN